VNVRSWIIVLCAVVSLTAGAVADPIKVSVRVNGTETVVDEFNYGEDVRINLRFFAVYYPGFDFIRVLDTSGTLGDISRISIYQSDNGPVPGVVRILVANTSLGGGGCP
jgi:hypothetical protein